MKEIPKQKIEESEEIEKTEEPEPPKEEIGSLTDLVLKTEQLEGKLEIIGKYKDELNERLTQISEEIGELRNMGMESDHSFSKLEKEFEEVKEIVGDVEPLKVKKVFEKNEQEIMESKVKIEKVENLLKALEKESENFRKTMEKIKSFENLVDISKKINEKIELIEDAKKYTDRTSSKVESMFSEITEKVNDLQSQKEKVVKLDELTTEITQMLDEISIKMKDFAKTNEFTKFKEETEIEIKKVIDSKEKIEEIRKIIETSKINEKINKVDEIEKKLDNIEKSFYKFKEIGKQSSDAKGTLPKIEEYSGIPEKIEKIKQIIEKQNSVISDIINSIETLKNIPNIDIHELNDFDLSLRFYQLLNIIPFLEDKVKLNEYSNEMKDIIRKMKESGSWDPQKERFMNDLVKVSKKMIKSGNQDEILDKMETVTNWVSKIADESQERKILEEQIKQDIENIKKVIREKVDSKDVEDVYILERELMQITGKFNKLKSVLERQNTVVNDLVEKINGLETERIDKDFLKKIELTNRFYQVLSLFPYITNQERLKSYSIEINQIIEDMKILGIWDKEKEEFIKDVFEGNKRADQIEQEKDEKIDEMKTKMIKLTDKSDFNEFKKMMNDEIKRLNESLRDKADMKSIDNILFVDKNVLDLTKRIEKLKSVVEKQNFVINDLITKLQEREVEGLDKKSVKDLQTTVRFYQILNMLPYIIEPTRVKSYILELKDIIEELKSNKEWNDEKERFMKNFLSSLADNYKSRGYDEIGASYAEII